MENFIILGEVNGVRFIFHSPTKYNKEIYQKLYVRERKDTIFIVNMDGKLFIYERPPREHDVKALAQLLPAADTMTVIRYTDDFAEYEHNIPNTPLLNVVKTFDYEYL